MDEHVTLNNKFRQFLEIDETIEITRGQLFQMVITKIAQKMNVSVNSLLTLPFKVDSEMTELFGVSMSVNNCNCYYDYKNGLNITNINYKIDYALQHFDSNSEANSGFCKLKRVEGKFANLIKVPNGTVLTGPVITRKVWGEIQNRGLFLENNKRVFRTDEEFSEVMGIRYLELDIF